MQGDAIDKILQFKSEEKFRNKCDENGFVYLFIDQGIKTKSSELWSSKRPDYLMTVPHIGPILVDVKAYKKNDFYERDFEYYNLDPPQCFTINLWELERFEELKKQVLLPVWFAIIPRRSKEGVYNSVNFIPTDLVERLMIDKHRKEPKWEYIQVPENCFTDCSNLARKACERCKEKYCFFIEDMINKKIPKNGFEGGITAYLNKKFPRRR